MQLSPPLLSAYTSQAQRIHFLTSAVMWLRLHPSLVQSHDLGTVDFFFF